MRILLLTSEFPPFNGGVATYARELAGAAISAGHEVVVLAPDYGTDQRDLDVTLPGRVVRFAGKAANAKGLIGRIMAARRILMAERFDVVHAVDWPFFIPLALSPRGEAKALLTVHGSELIYMQAPKRRKILGLLGFWRPGWARWIGNSKYTVDLLHRAFPAVRVEDARAIPLAVGDAWRRRRVPRSEAREKFSLTERDLVIVSLGRVVPRKGHLDLADAFMALPSDIADRLQWWIIGPLIDPVHAEELQRRIAGLRCSAELFGSLPTDEVVVRLCAADLFCLPGYQDGDGRVEGFGLVFLEAGAFGVPSIATRSGGIPEAVVEGVGGVLVPERDPRALAEAIFNVLGDAGRRAELATGAEALAAEATWHKVMAATYEAD